MLVDLEKHWRGQNEAPVAFDLVYATPRNFTGKPVYTDPLCYLHEDALPYLERAIKLAGELGLGFVIFDAFRPSEAQFKLWEHSPDPDFLSPPKIGSPHSRGVAVDLTLARPDGQPLEMGTGFDEFTELSHHGALGIAPEAQRNRAILLGIMIAAGWRHYEKEWWHYQLADARSYPLIGDGELGHPMMQVAQDA